MAAPISLGIILLVVFILALLRQRPISPAPDEGRGAGTGAPEAPRFPLPPGEIPAGPPEDPQGAAYSVRPPGSGIKRWVIDPLPEGWNPELAAKLAALFDRIDFDPSKPETLFDTDDALKALDELLAGLGPETLPTLAAILNAETNFVNRRHLLLGIGKMGTKSEEATFILLDFFARRYGDSNAMSEINYTIKAIGELKNSTSLDAIVRKIGDESVPHYYRDKFVIALGEHPRAAERKPVLIETMREGPEFGMRNHAAQALGKIATTDLLPDLMDAYEREPYWVGKQTILGSIGKVGDPSALPFLEERARLATESGVRLSAAAAIRRIGYGSQPSRGRVVSVLNDLARSDPDSGVRARILQWLEDGIQTAPR